MTCPTNVTINHDRRTDNTSRSRPEHLQRGAHIFHVWTSLESHWNVCSLLQNVCCHATGNPRTFQLAVTTWRAEARVMNLAPTTTRGGNNSVIVFPAAVHLFYGVELEIKSADKIEQVPDSQLEVSECVSLQSFRL